MNTKESEIKLLVGANLKRLRTDRQITQKALGEAVGISSNAIQALEKGLNYPQSKTLAGLCQILNIEPVELFRPARPGTVYNKPALLTDLHRLVQKITSDFPD